MNCLDCSKRLTKVNRSEVEELCKVCFSQAERENSHNDGYHDDIADPACNYCQQDANEKAAEAAEAAAAAKKHGSHAECYAKKVHEATRAGRAACRKARS